MERRSRKGERARVVVGSQDFRQEIWPERWLPLAQNVKPSLQCRVMEGKRGWKFRLSSVAIPEFPRLGNL